MLLIMYLSIKLTLIGIRIYFYGLAEVVMVLQLLVQLQAGLALFNFQVVHSLFLQFMPEIQPPEQISSFNTRSQAFRYWFQPKLTPQLWCTP